MSSFYQNNIISVLYILYFYVFIVDIGISSSSEFVKSNENSCAELITESDIPTDNVEHNNFILQSSNESENVDTFRSDIGTYINNINNKIAIFLS